MVVLKSTPTIELDANPMPIIAIFNFSGHERYNTTGHTGDLDQVETLRPCSPSRRNVVWIVSTTIQN